jgi:hypothetical protein
MTLLSMTAKARATKINERIGIRAARNVGRITLGRRSVAPNACR